MLIVTSATSLELSPYVTLTCTVCVPVFLPFGILVLSTMLILVVGSGVLPFFHVIPLLGPVLVIRFSISLSLVPYGRVIVLPTGSYSLLASPMVIGTSTVLIEPSGYVTFAFTLDVPLFVPSGSACPSSNLIEGFLAGSLDGYFVLIAFVMSSCVTAVPCGFVIGVTVAGYSSASVYTAIRIGSLALLPALSFTTRTRLHCWLLVESSRVPVPVI